MKRKIKYILAGLLGLIGLVSIGGRVVNAEESSEDNSQATTVTMSREYSYDFENNYTSKQQSVETLDKNYSGRKLLITTNKCDKNKNKGIKLGYKSEPENSQYNISFDVKGTWTLKIEWCLNSSKNEGGIIISGAIEDSNTFTSTSNKELSGTNEGTLTLSNKVLSNCAYISSLTLTINENVNVSETSYSQIGQKEENEYTTKFARFITAINNASELNDLSDATYQIVYDNKKYSAVAYVCDKLMNGENVYSSDGITFGEFTDVKYVICTVGYKYKDDEGTHEYTGDMTFNVILNGVTIATKTLTLE